MECLGPECASMLLEWLRSRAASGDDGTTSLGGSGRGQASLWTSSPYHEDAPAIRSRPELLGAIEHLEYSIFRRYENILTKAERARLDNTIDNALFKVDRYLE